MEPLAKDLIADDEHAMALILDLRRQLEKVTTKNESLEEECDLLAMENDRLRTLCQKHNINPDITLEKEPDLSLSTGCNIADNEEFLINAGGDDMYASSIGREIQKACGTGNALCVEYLHLTSSTSDAHDDYVMCGGVDKTLRLYALSTGTLVYQLVLAAPILAIDSFGSLVACSMMDGSHAVVDLNIQNYSELTETFIPSVLQSQRDHTKYVVSVQWCPRGEYLVTASHDKTVILYKREISEDTSSPVQIQLKHKLNLKEIPEDVIFCYLPSDFTNQGGDGSDLSNIDAGSLTDGGILRGDISSQQQKELHIIVPTRGASYLIYINCETLKHRKVSLNEHAWDTHCSFNVLHMNLSPSGKELLVATDKDFHIILTLGSNQRLSLLAGHMCNDYGKPKTAWDITGKYVYSNNQADHNVLVYAVNTGKIVATLEGHKGQVRDIKSHFNTRAVVTASYDHTVKEWVRSPAAAVV